MPKKKQPKRSEPQVIPNGTFCKTKRPNLWAGRDCVVEGYREGIYILRVVSVGQPSFQIAVPIEELQVISDKSGRSTAR